MRPLLSALAGTVFSGLSVGFGGAQLRPLTFSFQQVSPESGFRFHHVNGAGSQKHVEETMGSDGVFLDYAGDGWIDIFVIDGGSIADVAVASTARNRLFSNANKGTLADVTAGVGSPLWSTS